MKKTIEIYLIRHGDYNSSGSLSQDGVKQIKTAGESIKQTLSNLENIIIYTSPQNRAIESAKIIQEILSSEIKPEIIVTELLDCQRFGIEELVEKISKDSTTHAILVTHGPDIEKYVKIYPSKGQVIKKSYSIKAEVE